MIYRDDGEIRVERDDRGVRTAIIVFGGLSLVLALIVLVSARETGRFAVALGPIGMGAILCAWVYRNRPEVVILPDRVGRGRVGKRVYYWTPRAEIDHAQFFRGLFFEVILYRADGSIAAQISCPLCNPLELRQAFTEAGIPVK